MIEWFVDASSQCSSISLPYSYLLPSVKFLSLLTNKTPFFIFLVGAMHPRLSSVGVKMPCTHYFATGITLFDLDIFYCIPYHIFVNENCGARYHGQSMSTFTMTS